MALEDRAIEYLALFSDAGPNNNGKFFYKFIFSILFIIIFTHIPNTRDTMIFALTTSASSQVFFEFNIS